MPLFVLFIIGHWGSGCNAVILLSKSPNIFPIVCNTILNSLLSQSMIIYLTHNVLFDVLRTILRPWTAPYFLLLYTDCFGPFETLQQPLYQRLIYSYHSIIHDSITDFKANFHLSYIHEVLSAFLHTWNCRMSVSHIMWAYFHFFCSHKTPEWDVWLDVSVRELVVSSRHTASTGKDQQSCVL